MHPRTLPAFLAQGHCWLKDSLLSTRTSKSFLAEMLSSRSAPRLCCWCTGYFPPGTGPCLFRPILSLFSLLITCIHVTRLHENLLQEAADWKVLEINRTTFSRSLGNLQQQTNSITEKQPSSKATLLSSRKNVIDRYSAVTNAWQPGFYVLNISPLTQAFMSGKLQSCLTVIHKWLVKAGFNWSTTMYSCSTHLSLLTDGILR